MGEFFGTDGIRGVAGQFPLDKPTIERIGFSLARHLKAQQGRNPEIVIGRDTRESGGWMEEAIARGAATAGAKIRSAGVITTPGVAYLTRQLGADAGIVISACSFSNSANTLRVLSSGGGDPARGAAL